MDQGRMNLSETGAGSASTRSVGPGVSKSPNKELSLIELKHIVLKHRYLVASTLLASLTLAIAFSILVPRKYEAVAELELEPQNSNALGVSGLDLLSGSDIDEESRQATQVHVLRTDALAWSVIKELRLDTLHELAGKEVSSRGEDPDKVGRARQALLLSAFSARLKVIPVPKTRIIQVRFRSLDPKLAANVTNAITKMYLRNTLQSRFQSTEEASDWLTRQLQGLKEQVESSQNELEDYQKKAGILITDEGLSRNDTGTSTHNVVIAKLDELNRQCADAQGQRMVAEAKYRIGLSGNAESIVGVEPASPLAVLRAQQVDLNNQYAQLTAKFGDKYDRVIQLKNQMEETSKSISSELDRIQKRLKAQYEAALKSEQMLSAEYEAQKQLAYSLNESSIKYLILKQDFDANQGLYQDLVRKLREAGILAGLKSTNATVIEPAAVPVKPASPVPLFNIAIGLMIGTFAGLGGAFLIENLDASIATPEDAESLSGFTLMSVVPRLTEKGARHVGGGGPTGGEGHVPIVMARPQSAFAESLRLLRTALMLSSPGAPPQTIAVTSGIPGEGKTMISLNLAAVLGQKHRKVLLVDADLRRAGLSRRLGFGKKLGLSSCLSGTAEPSDVLLTLPSMPNVQILPAGTRPPDPADLLDSVRMRALIAQWRQEYDQILIDTPPLLGLTDSALVSSLTDFVLLIVRSSKTTRQTLLRSRDALVRANSPKIGIVFNDLASESADHYAYYGYHGSEYNDYYSDESGRDR